MRLRARYQAHRCGFAAPAGSPAAPRTRCPAAPWPTSTPCSAHAIYVTVGGVIPFNDIISKPATIHGQGEVIMEEL